MNERITIIKGEIYKVKEYTDDTKLKPGFAYIKNGFIYPYLGEYTPKVTRDFGVYHVGKKKDRIHHFIKPIFFRINEGYLEQNVRQVNKDNILSIIENDDDVLIDIDSDVILSEQGDLFTPQINEEDNFLSRIIKDAACRKRIDLNNYLNRFESTYQMNNFRRALLQNGNMSVDKFLKWCDVFDIEFEITYSDKANSINPMNYTGKIVGKK